MVQIYKGRSYKTANDNIRITIRAKIPLTEKYLVEFLTDNGSVWDMRWKQLENREIKKLLNIPRNQKLMIITK